MPLPCLPQPILPRRMARFSGLCAAMMLSGVAGIGLSQPCQAESDGEALRGALRTVLIQAGDAIVIDTRPQGVTLLTEANAGIGFDGDAGDRLAARLSFAGEDGAILPYMAVTERGAGRLRGVEGPSAEGGLDLSLIRGMEMQAGEDVSIDVHDGGLALISEYRSGRTVVESRVQLGPSFIGFSLDADF